MRRPTKVERPLCRQCGVRWATAPDGFCSAKCARVSIEEPLGESRENSDGEKCDCACESLGAGAVRRENLQNSA